MRFGIYDEIILKIEETCSTNNISYREAKVMIIGGSVNVDNDHAEFICYVPPYENVPSSFRINKKHIRWYHLDDKYLNDDAVFITRLTPIYRHIPSRDGTTCDVCEQFVDYAERNSNFEFTCRQCRENGRR